jgi:hypothetical protein
MLEALERFRMKIVLFIYIAAIALSGFGYCNADTVNTPSSTFTSHGFVAFENAQVVKGILPSAGEEIRKAWLERAILQLRTDFNINDQIHFILAIEGQYGFSYPQSIGARESMWARYWMYPSQVEATYSLGNKNKPYLQFGMGYFPFKYNQYSVNLGEFLFRSGTYPPYLVNNFNMPFNRLLGFRLSSTLFGSLKQDLLFTSETQIFPTQDFSLSYLAHYSPAPSLQIGAGVSMAHLISIEHRLTSPSLFPDPADPRRFTPEDKNSIMYIKENGDTGFYSFKGIKPMAMFSFDPKPLLSGSFPELVGLLGKDDGVLYGEMCVIGWENFKNYTTDTTLHYPDFRNRWDRTPIMVGFNIPAFKVLDVFSLEVEHFTDKYANSYKNVIDRNLPAYFPIPQSGLTAWKWSLYAKKTFLKKFSLIGQVARDHMRPSYPNYILTERDDLLSRPGDWWWALRILVKY